MNYKNSISNHSECSPYVTTVGFIVRGLLDLVDVCQAASTSRRVASLKTGFAILGSIFRAYLVG